MKHVRNITKRFAVSTLIVLTSLFVVTTAWSAMSLFDNTDKSSIFNPGVEELTANSAAKAKARAPEPTTLALFGSGIVGMVISFVRKTYAIAKRAFDIVVSLVAIVVLSPLFIFTALLVKLTSRGPMIYTQIRMGKSGKLFKIYKFRTMKVDAEKTSGAVWAQENDPRLIPAGKFIRKSHLDEIPQFINVLQGHMSVVGPRPERPEFVAKLKVQIPDYEKRLAVKPGITGLAQVWHRYDETIEDVKKKVKYDLLYIKKICLWTDVRIFFRTFRVVLTGEGAR